jgi:hypothetical protein
MTETRKALEAHVDACQACLFLPHHLLQETLKDQQFSDYQTELKQFSPHHLY